MTREAANISRPYPDSSRENQSSMGLSRNHSFSDLLQIRLPRRDLLKLIPFAFAAALGLKARRAQAQTESALQQPPVETEPSEAPAPAVDSPALATGPDKGSGVDETGVEEALGGGLLDITFGPQYDGKNPERERVAQKLLNSVWGSASARSKTLGEAAAFFIKNTTGGISPQKFDDFRDRGQVLGDVSIEVRAPEAGFITVHPDIPIGLRVGVFPGTNTTPKGETTPITKIDMVLLVGNVDHKFDPNSIEEYAQFLLLPRALAAYTNLELRELMVRQGVSNYDDVKARVGDTGSDFYDRVAVKALDKTFQDTRNVLRESPDGWDNKNTLFRAAFSNWQAITEKPGSTEDDRYQFIRQNMLGK